MVQKKLIVIAAVSVILIILSITSILKKEKQVKLEEISLLIEKAEDSVKSNGILQLNIAEYPKFTNIQLDVYYKESLCLERIEDIVNKFENVRIENIAKAKKLPDNIVVDDIKFPVVILKDSNRERIINGLAACSALILTYSICDSIKNPPESCNDYLFIKKKISGELSVSEDKECYQACFVEYSKNNNIISQLWHSWPCERIDGYIAGLTKVINKRCLGKSCANDIQDRACCNKLDCVYENKCYSQGEIYDIDNDAQKEACMLYKNNSLWTDPDKDSSTCALANYSWFDCSPKTECANAINSFGKKKTGLCCGDDRDESLTVCIGGICSEADSACCRPNQCAFGNKCYSEGCAALKTELGTKKAYCNGNEWVDLDEQYCEKCMGKKSWTGQLCCGDDEDEPSHYKELIFHNETSIKPVGQFYCTDERSQCISLINGTKIPDGCHIIPPIEENSKGKYYCKNGEWYDADYSKKYCERCSYNWFAAGKENRCCGDEEKEYLVKGIDGTTACCDSSETHVEGGKCTYSLICGDNIVEGNEICEPPGTKDSIYCNQTTEFCLDRKLGIRDNLGDCSKGCDCKFDDFSYSCVKGKCNAECTSDKDCSTGQLCNTDDCGCYDKQLNFSDCPERVYLTINKKKLYIDDIFTLEISIRNSENISMPNVRFWLDIVVDSEAVGASLYSTDQEGRYIIEKSVVEALPMGMFRFIVKVIHKDCNIISNTIEAEFIPDKTTRSTFIITKKLSYGRKKDIIREWNLTKISSQEPLCGNNEIEVGEECEENSICRTSLGCDYAEHKYDVIEYCNNCRCPIDRWSGSGSREYCENCGHCDDGLLNCGELCENKTIDAGLICKDDHLNKQLGICTECSYFQNITTNTVVDNCTCECPDSPEENCLDGNYILYPEDYFAGCSLDSCNRCECQDIYEKDSDLDGVEDKCEPEICSNKIDDNDNSLIDEKECIWYYCSQCGWSLFNLCDKEECADLRQGCFFEETIFGYGFCSECSLLGSCEDYYYNKDNCIEDPCNLSSCFWNNITCCTDIDKDKICDYNDNCPSIFNPLQEDTDSDGKGNKCDLCDKEPHLFFPQAMNEIICNDSIDNDCDYLIDCADKDCPCINISQGAVNET